MIQVDFNILIGRFSCVEFRTILSDRQTILRMVCADTFKLVSNNIPYIIIFVSAHTISTENLLYFLMFTSYNHTQHVK